jgi:hypothetical protein
MSDVAGDQSKARKEEKTKLKSNKITRITNL